MLLIGMSLRSANSQQNRAAQNAWVSTRQENMREKIDAALWLNKTWRRKERLGIIQNKMRGDVDAMPQRSTPSINIG